MNLEEEILEEKKKMRRFVCYGCGDAITDQYVLQVAPDLEWHAPCLKCSDCGRQLNEHCTCFVRDGKTYCKTDYLRLFGVRCFRCSLGFNTNDLVMLARNQIYHVECFRCFGCCRQLLPGDEYSITDGELYCRLDHDALDRGSSFSTSTTSTIVAVHPPLPPPPPPTMITMAGGCRSPTLSQRGSMDETGTTIKEKNNEFSKTTAVAENDNNSPEHSSSNQSNLSNGGLRQVGPAGRTCNSAPGKKSSSSCAPNGTRTAGATSNGVGSSTKSSSSHKSDQKTTRVRTVLNEKQLHTLRTCYAANPRPDALMKDQLVEMTGLSSRVIRVWFQNKRCKDKKRTILIKQIQQQHQDKLQGVPMIASSPISHESASELQSTPVIVHQYIHHPSWINNPGGGGGVESGVGEYVPQVPSNTQISEMDNQQQQQQAPFQQLLSSFGESDDDDTVVSLDEPALLQSFRAQHHQPHQQQPSGIARRLSRYTTDYLHQRGSLHPLNHVVPHHFITNSSNSSLRPAQHHPSLKAFDTKC